MRRWRFALAILFAAVLLICAVSVAGPAWAQSDAKLKTLNDRVTSLSDAVSATLLILFLAPKD